MKQDSRGFEFKQVLQQFPIASSWSPDAKQKTHNEGHTTKYKPIFEAFYNLDFAKISGLFRFHSFFYHKNTI